MMPASSSTEVANVPLPFVQYETQFSAQVLRKLPT
jgi:hypothetical protein